MLAACSTPQPTATMAPTPEPTATPTDTPPAAAKQAAPTTEPAGITVTFEGDQCIYHGPERIPAGRIPVVLDVTDQMTHKVYGVGAVTVDKGKTLEEASQITNKDVAEALEGLPKNKLHCSNLGADALQMAIKDYYARKAGKVRPEPEHVEVHKHTGKGKCLCPYCDIEIKEDATFCEACHSNLEEEH